MMGYGADSKQFIQLLERVGIRATFYRVAQGRAGDDRHPWYIVYTSVVGSGSP